VVIPSPEQEDAKRLSRERTQLAAEKTRHTNRIRGLLALHGIREIKGLWGGEWAEGLGGGAAATCAPRSRAGSSASTSSCGTCAPSMPTGRRRSPRRLRPSRTAT